jgi:hypothetical protein
LPKRTFEETAGFWAIAPANGVFDAARFARQGSSMRVLADEGWCVVGGIARAYETLLWQDVAGFGAIGVIGSLPATIMDRTAAHRPLREDFIDQCVRHPESLFDTHDGSFQVLVLDRFARSVTLYSDHLVSRQVFVADGPAGSGFATNCWIAVALTGLKPAISSEGATGFLALGYPIAPATLLDGVSRVPIGHAVSVRSRGGIASSVMIRIWRPRFPQPRAIGLREAVEELDETLLASHRRATSDLGSNYMLALTGGVDARLLLAMAIANGIAPCTTFTWTAESPSRRSDAVHAARLARMAAVSHTVLRYDEDRFVKHLDEWFGFAGSLSDNLGHLAAGPHFLAEYELPRVPVMIGDQLLGLGPAYASPTEAIAHALGIPWPSLPAALEELLDAPGRTLLRDRLQEQIQRRLSFEDDASHTPKNVHLAVSLLIATQGWLLAPGYAKEPFYDARRPMMSVEALQLVAQWPPELRTDKRVLIALLRAKYGPLAREPVADAASGYTNWPRTVRASPSIRGFLGSVNSERLSAIMGVAVAGRNQAVVDAILSQPEAGMRPRTEALAKRFVSVRRRLATVPGASRAFRWLWGPARSSRGPSRLRMAFRLAILDRLTAYVDALDPPSNPMTP